EATEPAALAEVLDPLAPVRAPLPARQLARLAQLHAGPAGAAGPRGAVEKGRDLGVVPAPVDAHLVAVPGEIGRVLGPAHQRDPAAERRQIVGAGQLAAGLARPAVPAGSRVSGESERRDQRRG